MIHNWPLRQAETTNGRERERVLGMERAQFVCKFQCGENITQGGEKCHEERKETQSQHRQFAKPWDCLDYDKACSAFADQRVVGFAYAMPTHMTRYHYDIPKF